jgi:O-antigen ligase
MNKALSRINIFQLFYQFILSYYWLMLYIPSTSNNVEKYSIWYFIIILPTYGFILLNSINILRIKQSIQSTYLVVFLLLVLLISIIRLDIATAYNVLLMSLVLIGMFNSKIKVSPPFLFIIFYISIFLGWVTYLLGTNYYNIFPNLSNIGSLLNMNASTWRISLFPSAPSSAFFSLIVFFINYYYRKPGVFKKITFALSLYFVVLGGSRTGIIILIFWGIFMLITKFISFNKANFYKFFNPIALVVFVLIINLSTVIFYFSTFFKNDFMNELLFRSKGQVQDESTIIEKNSRQIIWQSHLTLFSQSPIIGKGTYNFYELFPNIDIVGRSDKINVSESFLTDWLARIGLMIIPFLLFLLSLQSKAITNRSKAQYSIAMALFITLLTYGSFMTPYSFMFYLFFGSLKEIS